MELQSQGSQVDSTHHVCARQRCINPHKKICKTASMFYNTTETYPGPGKYNPERLRSKTYIHMAGRPISNYSTISPGPKYNFESTLLDRNKILSQEKRKGSCRIVLPSSKSRLAMSSVSDTKINLSKSCKSSFMAAIEGMTTNKGQKMFGHSGPHATITRE
jgi:hypothetical protein